MRVISTVEVPHFYFGYGTISKQASQFSAGKTFELNICSLSIERSHCSQTTPMFRPHETFVSNPRRQPGIHLEIFVTSLLSRPFLAPGWRRMAEMPGHRRTSAGGASPRRAAVNKSILTTMATIYPARLHFPPSLFLAFRTPPHNSLSARD